MKHCISSLASFLQTSFTLMDVGARGGFSGPWNDLADVKLAHGQPLIKGIFFEADPVEAAQLTQDTDNIVLPYAVGAREEKRPLYLTKARRCSSLLEPNIEFLKHFPEVDRFTVEETLTLQTHALDTLHAQGTIPVADFAKFDVQGMELDVLKGGKNYFSKALLGAEIEVEFKSMYTQQPLFRHVDAFMSDVLNMDLYDLQRFFFKYSEGKDIGPHRGQLVFANALYLYTPESILDRAMLQSQTDAKNTCLKAILMAMAYGQMDYALHLLAQDATKYILSPTCAKQIEDAVRKDAQRLHFNQGRFTSRLYSWAQLVVGLFQPTYDKWAVSDPCLGASPRRRKIFWY